MCYICHYRGEMFLYENMYNDIFILCKECMDVADDIREYNVNLMQMFEEWFIQPLEDS